MPGIAVLLQVILGMLYRTFIQRHINQDYLGRYVATLSEGYQQPGTYSAVFDGSGLASGMYFAVLQAGDFRQTQKLILLK